MTIREGPYLTQASEMHSAMQSGGFEVAPGPQREVVARSRYVLLPSFLAPKGISVKDLALPKNRDSLLTLGSMSGAAAS